VPQGSVLGRYIFTEFINGLRNSINHCKCLIFADDLKIFRVNNSPHDWLLLQSDINSVSDWCAANTMRLNIAKTHVVLYCRKTSILRHEYQLCHAAITRTSSIKDLGVFFDSKLYFHSHVDFIYSEGGKLLGLIRSITLRFSSLGCLFALYFTLVRSKLEYTSVVWNSVTSTDTKKLERIQQKSAPLRFCRFSPHVPYSYTFALEKLSLHSLRKRRHLLDELFFFFFLLRSVVALNPLGKY
jgi:hypothetical protein